MFAKERVRILIVGAMLVRPDGLAAWRGTLPTDPERRPGRYPSSILGPPAWELLRPNTKTDAVPSETGKRRSGPRARYQIFIIIRKN